MKNKILILTWLAITLLTSSATLYAQSSGSNQSARNSYRIGDLVEAADYRGVWYKSKITDEDKGKYRVHFLGWDEAWDEWVTTDKIRQSNDPDFKREVEVEQKGIWRQAIIVDERYGTDHLVAYTDGDEEEWVKDDRIREVGAGYERDGEWIEVLSGKNNDKWRRAMIVKRRCREVYVHYDGEDDVWNEWVSTDKIRRGR